MSQVNIIKHKDAKWDRHGESFSQFLIVSADHDDDVYDEYFRRCGCEHDCCGHVQTSVYGLRKLSEGRFAVRVGGYRNV
jgi:hypothetical protein